jgi:flagellar biosynthesis/type III secretory pathway protein FliH
MALKHLIGPLLVTAVFAVPATALAQSSGWQFPADQTRYRISDDAPTSYAEVRRIAYDQGYRQGIEKGQQDARRGQRFDYRNEREFERADRGYNRGYGDRDRYRQVFRDGYANGYSDGFSRSARYSGPSQRPGVYGQQGGYGAYGGYGGGARTYYSPALDNGARDGYEKGQEDARKNRSYDPLRHSWYRSGDRHYEDQYGSRDRYKDLYRQGFQQGYEQGFRNSQYRY